ncbi:hypothetical protein [Mesobacillus jeotgali]|uniref:hypothetical protein n=1 Tax=Mesobacillus jeotgali TaxID=129985 RepID=UPI001CFF4EBE|nr:hypothetical protein [Mesobacillus jeotgali]
MENNKIWAMVEDGRTVTGNDFSHGDYKVGGYVWEVGDMKMLDRFIPAKGRLGLGEYEV